jgi:hypothetical protein
LTVSSIAVGADGGVVVSPAMNASSALAVASSTKSIVIPRGSAVACIERTAGGPSVWVSAT